MSLLSKLMLFIAIGIFLPLNQYAQTTLSPGDIVIIRVNSSDDSFDFIPLVDLASGTVIKFTDNAREGSAFRSGESTLIYTTPTGCIIFNEGYCILYSLCKKTPNTALFSFLKQSFTGLPAGGLVSKTSKALSLTFSCKDTNIRLHYNVYCQNNRD